MQLENGRPVPVRLGMCRDLLEAQKNMERAKSSGSVKARVLVAHRANAIRRALLGKSADLADELLSPTQTAARLTAILDGLEGKSDAERVRAATYVGGIAEVMSTLMRAEHTHGVLAGATDFYGIKHAADKVLIDTGGLKQADPVIDAAIGTGAFGDELRSELASAAAAGEIRRVSQNSLVAQMAAQFEKVKVQEEDWTRRYHEMHNRTYHGTEAEREAAGAELEALRTEWYAWRADVFMPVRDAHHSADAAAREAEKSARATVGRKIVERLLTASGVTEDAATAWAAVQEITSQAKARLRKIGYPVDDVRRDMAEFYRITGGRLAGARIHSNGSRRANATDIESHGKVGTINLDSSFDKRVLWHELGHHLEADPVAKAAAGRFIRRRSVDGGKVRRLRDMTGNRGYASSEVALDGKFFNPYVGKVYRDGVTEVFSMGVETFSDPALLAKRATDDPQTIEFIAGYLATPLDELGRAHMRLREILREATDDAAEQVEAEVETAVAQVAKLATFTSSDDRAWMGNQDWMWKEFKVLGYFDIGGGKWWAVSGKFKVWGSGRKVQGFYVIQPSEGGGMTRNSFPSKDFDLLKVAMVKYERTGVFQSDIEYLKQEVSSKAFQASLS